MTMNQIKASREKTSYLRIGPKALRVTIEKLLEVLK